MKKKEYFSSLNYTLANEDTEFEYDITQAHNPLNIVSVCGSGSRCFPLITQDTQNLYCVDLSVEQLYLAKLREQTYKSFDHKTFCQFWGYAPFKAGENCKAREIEFNKLKLELEVQNYFKSLFESIGWESVLYMGKWERTFTFFSKIIKKALSEKHTHKLFSFEKLENQLEYVNNEFPALKWKIIMAILGNKSMFNALLYKGEFIKKNVDDSYLQYYSKAFNHLMSFDDVKKSFFMQLCFHGEIIYPEGNLIEARPEVFEQIKKNLETCKVHYLKKDILSAVSSLKKIDYVSLSDVPSYFSGEVERDFFQMIIPGLSPKAIVVNRNYLRIPNSNKSNYLNITSQYEDGLKSEKVQMYRIEVLSYE